MRKTKNITPQVLDNIQALITECGQHVCDDRCPFYDGFIPHFCLIGHPYSWGITMPDDEEEYHET